MIIVFLLVWFTIGYITKKNAKQQIQSRKVYPKTPTEQQRSCSVGVFEWNIFRIANYVISEHDIPETYEQLDLFSNFESVEEKHKQKDTELECEKELQKVMIALQKRFGKNIVLKGLNLKEGEKTIVKESRIYFSFFRSKNIFCGILFL